MVQFLFGTLNNNSVFSVILSIKYKKDDLTQF